MRVALLGGTFDPPHRGHIALARLARKRLSLDRVLVAPVAAQPLKRPSPSASFADRVAMARLAFAGEPNTEISLIDAPRVDGSSNFTIDTIAALRSDLAPSDVLFCILGADSFLAIRNWHRAADLLLACDFIVGARPGFDLAQAASALPKEISAKPMPSEIPQTGILELTAGKKVPKARASARSATHLYLLLDLAEDVSATQIRADIQAALSGIAQHHSILPSSVAKYIRVHHLYEHL